MTARRSGDNGAPATVVVGRIVRAHGIHGDVVVEVRTDSADQRFVAGAVLPTDPTSVGPLEVRRARWHSGRLLVAFEGIADRDAAEALRGVRLEVAVEPDATTGDPDEFFDHQLMGLVAETVDGEQVGTVADVVHLPGQDLLAVNGPAGQVLVPFVTAIVPVVDVSGGRIIVDPPPGLLDATLAVEAGPDEAGR